jgi:NTP pyrophosphatase (non-canonical NTP hydrolase)
VHLRDYQRKAMSTRQPTPPGSDPAQIHLAGLVAEVGAIAGQYHRQRHGGSGYGWSKTHLREEMGDVLWYLTALAEESGLEMADIAVANLTKTAHRWMPTTDWQDFDSEYPATERLPQLINYEFRTDRRADGTLQTRTYLDGQQVGDPLTDSSPNPDGYRLHDIFHLSYATKLGWSPVTRALLKRKRRSIPAIDENEDGGRAIAIEEGLAATIFTHAATRDYLRDARHVDGDFLAVITNTVGHLEVGVCSAADWEQAILAGFQIWHQLLDYDGWGIVQADLHAHTLSFTPLPSPGNEDFMSHGSA